MLNPAIRALLKPVLAGSNATPAAVGAADAASSADAPAGAASHRGQDDGETVKTLFASEASPVLVPRTVLS